MSESRLHQLQAVLQESELDGLALLPGPSLFYLTGISFHLMERPIVVLVPARGDPALILPEMEGEKAQSLPYTALTFTYSEDPSSQPDAFSRAGEKLSLDHKRLGVEPLGMRYQESVLLRMAVPSVSLVDGAETIASLRMKKDDKELEAMRSAAEVAEAALAATLAKIEFGMTERELAAELIVQLLGHGSDGELPFQPIVASGPNSALPHTTPSDRALSPGDLLLLDWGASVSGYCSDITRTFALGEPDDELNQVHEIVQRANEAAREAAGPGVSCAAVDRAARAVISEAGYGQNFIHRTGHGLGLEVHEAPYLHEANDQPLAPGMTFTIEPGIYLRGKGGVRVEDDVVITSDGCESLTRYRRDLQRLP